MSQQISVIGQIATEPKLFAPEGGVQFCSFRLASTDRRYDPDRKEWVDRDTNWYTVNAFRSLALNAKESFSIGDRVIITGRLRVRKWEKGEKQGTSVEIDADGFGHDLRWGTSQFTKRDASAGASTSAASSESSAAHDHQPPTSDGSDDAGSEDGFIPGATLSEDPYGQPANAA